MKGLKLQIRIEPEMKGRWQAEALASHKTLTQYIVDRVEGAGVIPEKGPIIESVEPTPIKEWGGPMFKDGKLNRIIGGDRGFK